MVMIFITLTAVAQRQSKDCLHHFEAKISLATLQGSSKEIVGTEEDVCTQAIGLDGTIYDFVRVSSFDFSNAFWTAARHSPDQACHVKLTFSECPNYHFGVTKDDQRDVIRARATLMP